MTASVPASSEEAPRGGPRWELSLLFFFVWIAVEDQVRKSLENPLAIYLVKDVVLAYVLLRCIQTTRRRRRRRALPSAFVAILLWGVVLYALGAFNPLLANRLAALVGIKLTFSYIPLVYLGYRFAEAGGRIDRFCRSVLVTGVIVSLIGVYQATVDPTFLNPEASGGLEGAQLRLSREGVPYVTSTFLSPGRYAFYLLNVFAMGLYVLLVERRHRLQAVWLTLLAVVVLGLVTTGARLGLAALPLLIGTLFVVAWIRSAHRRFRAGVPARSGTALVVVVLLFSVAILGLASNFSPVVADALAFYWNSFFSQGAQGFWDRQLFHVEEITKADAMTLVFGRGTGSASFGVGYLQDAPELMTEGGYASAIWELGILGLVYYCVLAGYVSSIFIGLRRVAARGTPLIAFVATFTPLVVFELWYVNVLGPVLQQYVVAVFLWFLTGVCLALRDGYGEAAGSLRTGPASAPA